jgi:hypothetical protein
MTRRFVILTAALLVLAQLSLAQFSSARPSTQKRDTGPRALALLELSPDGAGHLVPIAIMIGDDFFDASAYKADPVPMALDSGTVYEAVQTGVSQGLFTITTAAQTGIYWTGRGKWQDSAQVASAAAAKKKRAEAKPPTLSDPDSGPPKLLRRSPEGKSESKPSSPSGEPAKPNTSATASVPPQSPAPAASKTAPASPAPSESKPAQTTPAPPAPTTSASAKAEAPPAAPAPAAAPTPPTPDPSEVSDEQDPNRPRLDRGKPTAARKNQVREPNGALNSKTANAKNAASAKPRAASSSPKASSTSEGPSVPDSVQEIPAISDAAGPEPRSYAFPLKPGEADQFRKKLVAQATQLVDAKIKQQSSGEPVHRATRASAKSKPIAHLPEPTFQNVKLRVFDLSSSNQALMVLQATAQAAGLAEPQQITIVARQDLYGELHDALANITDEKHLDVISQMDLIDVVDADGDGRGELLFRETSDEGRAYSIYRVIGDQLYQLYKSTPQ